MKEFIKLVQANWHDGYEEQEELVLNWCMETKDDLQAVLNVATGSRTAFDRCIDVLRTLEDSYAHIRCVPARSCLEDVLSNIDEKLPLAATEEHSGVKVERDIDSPTKMFKYVWSEVLAHACAAGAPRDVILRGIKDACDYGWVVDDMPKYRCSLSAHSESNADEAPATMKTPPGRGCELLNAMCVSERAAWSTLPSLLKQHKSPKVVDRRFSGKGGFGGRRGFGGSKKGFGFFMF